MRISRLSLEVKRDLMELGKKSLQVRSVQIKSDKELMKLCEFLQCRSVQIKSEKELMRLEKKSLQIKSDKDLMKLCEFLQGKSAYLII